jgi:UMF1 family MFS transporter
MSDGSRREDRVYRRVINAWCMYDWANSAFATTVMSALFPPFYRSLVTEAGLPESNATAYWGYTTSIALLAMALMAPILGATADYTGGKKRYAAFFVTLGLLFTVSFVFIGSGGWLLASVLYLGAVFGFSGANLFYESLLPHIAVRGDIDQVSTRGYAFGYIGGGVVLAVNVLWVMRPSAFGMPDTAFAIRASFASVAVWWGLFSIPFFRRVPQPPPDRVGLGTRAAPLEGFARLIKTFREIRRYRQLVVFLFAFWVYSDGIGTIIRMATAYGDEIGIGLVDMMAALVLTQFVAIPFSFLFGGLAKRLGAKRCILLTLGVYAAVSVSAFFMQTALHFYVLAVVVGTVQGGTGALSRSLFGSMVPRHKASEFFGFFSASVKFAGIAGPLVFGIVSQIAGHSRLSILSLIAFFIVGMAILRRLDVEEGVRVARSAEREHGVSTAGT